MNAVYYGNISGIGGKRSAIILANVTNFLRKVENLREDKKVSKDIFCKMIVAKQLKSF